MLNGDGSLLSQTYIDQIICTHTKLYTMEDTNNQVEINDYNVNDNVDIEEDSDDDGHEEVEFNESTLQKLKQNDATVTRLHVPLHCDDNSEPFFNCIDWKYGDGNCIVNSKHLKKLHINFEYPEEDNDDEEEGDDNLPSKQQLQDFFSCVCRNNSIKYIHIDSFHIFEGICGSLLEGLCGHPSLTGLEIEFCRFRSNVGLKALGKVLKHPASNVKELHLPNCQLDDEEIGIMCGALMGNNVLKRLSFSGNRVYLTPAAWQALATVLQHPTCKLIKFGLHELKELNLTNSKHVNRANWQSFLNQLRQTSLVCLDLNQNNIVDDDLAALAAIGTLKSLFLSRNESITPAGWSSFFSSLQTRGTQLVRLDINTNRVGNVGLVALGSLLNSMSTLKTLMMGGMDDHPDTITSQGWEFFFTTLQGSNLNLVDLDLSVNSIGDDGIQLLVPLVSRMTSLKCLDLSETSWLTPTGWQALAGFLQSPNFALEELYLGENNINDDTVITFTSALVNNKTLKGLYLWGCLEDDENESITERGWAAISTLVCNKSSIVDTYNSNHILHDLDCEPSYSSITKI